MQFFHEIARTDPSPSQTLEYSSGSTRNHAERKHSVRFGQCECRCECLHKVRTHHNPLEIVVFEEGIYINNLNMIPWFLHAQFDWIYWYIPPYVNRLKLGQLDSITGWLTLNRVKMVSCLWITRCTHLLFLRCFCCSVENCYMPYFCPFPLSAMCVWFLS